MPKYRLNSIATLAGQMKFTPQATRQTQLTGAEQLLLSLEASKAYPFDFIVFKITGYRPKKADSDLLIGSALQHDLGLLIEQVSQSLAMRVRSMSEPVLSIDDMSRQFNVTSKTIQRWRRRGLPARRFIYPDGKCRVGFRLGVVERFFANHQRQAAQNANLASLDEAEYEAILRHARLLAARCGCWEDELARRIGRRFNRSPLTILHTLRKHDQDHPTDAILPLAQPPIAEEQRQLILQALRRKGGLTELARCFHRPRWAIYRVLLEDRVARLNRRSVRFIDDPLYHQPGAQMLLDEILAQDALGAEPPAEQVRVPRDLPPYLRALYRTPLLSPARERGLFLKYNFHKYQFVMARRRLDLEQVRRRDLQRLENLLGRAVEVKNEIVCANLRLVVSVARRHLRPGLDLMELISDGNLTLLRAVESFDVHRGNRFSTYATLALMKGFARSVPLMLASQAAPLEGICNLPDPQANRVAAQLADRDEVGVLLRGLSEGERRVVAAEYGLMEGGSHPMTQRQLAQTMCVSRQRIRQLEQQAMAKLHHAAGAK